MRFVVLLLLAFVTPAFADPSVVILIRHGEKPKEGGSLDAAGLRRASELPEFFRDNARLQELGAPGGIGGFYAMAQKKKNSSNRPYETISPTAEALGLPVNNEFEREDVKGLVKAIRKDPAVKGKIVVVCWEHTVIRDIAKQFGLSGKQIPKVWMDEDYNSVWIFKLDKKGEPITDTFEITKEIFPKQCGLTAAKVAKSVR